MQVDAYKEYAGGLFKGIHEPIIDMATWKMVQEKLKRPIKTRTIIDDELPLRGVINVIVVNHYQEHHHEANQVNISIIINVSLQGIIILAQ